MVSLLLAVIYLIFISLGLPDSLLGAGWPTMGAQLDVPLSYAGIVSMIIAGGTICSSLLSERLTRKAGTFAVTAVSILLTAAALFGFSTATRFWMLCLWAVPYGLGAGAIDSAINNYVALHYSSRHMSWLHCFWGVGTIISPYIMSFALSVSCWNDGYRWVSYLQFGILAAVLCSLPLWRKMEAKDPVADSARVLGIRGALKIRGAPFLLIGFFAYCAAEATAMLWSSSFLVGTRGISEEQAAAFASLFFIGITAGRFVSGFVSEKLGDQTMIRIGTGVALAAVVLISLPVQTDVCALAGLVAFGAGCAPVYPSVIHSTPKNFGAENSRALIGIQMASAYLGSTFMPPLFGLIANHVSLGLFPLYLLVFMALMIVMLEITRKKVKGREEPAAPSEK